MKRLLGFLLLCACGGPHDFSGGDASSDAPTFADVHLGDSSVLCGRYVLETYDPGPDGRLGTSDDVIHPGRDVQIATPLGQISVVTRDTMYSGPGADGVWDTDDDVVVRDQRIVSTSATTYDQMTYDGNAQVTGRSSGEGSEITPSAVYDYASPGTDGTWGTSDDVVSGWSKFVYGDGAATPFLQQWQYTSPGTSSLGIVTSRFTGWGMFSTAAGPDGTFGTKDDVITGRYTDDRNTNGRFQTLTSYGQGDTVASMGIVTCTAGVYDGRILSAPGPDGTWLTDDDVVQVRMRTTACGSCDDLPKSPVAPN